MTRSIGPRPDLLRDAALPLTIVVAIAIPAVAMSVVWLAGHAASWLSGNGWNGPPLNLDFGREVAENGIGAPWPDTSPVLVGVIIGLLALLVLAPPMGVVMWLLLRSPGPGRGARSLARPRDLPTLTPRGSQARAQQLRPRDASDDPASHGIRLGKLAPRGPVLRASWEDVALAIMAPRSGKTTSLAVETILDAPGPAVGTSNKADLHLATAELRAQATGEPVWTFDPQSIVFAPRSWWWNPLSSATDVDGAHRLAEHFVGSVQRRGERNFWDSAATDLLTSLFLAAASSSGSLVTVDEWLGDPTQTLPAEILQEHGFSSAARSLLGRQNGAPETRDGIYETARTAAQCLRSPQIIAWVTPPTTVLPEFDPTVFANSRQTLYLLSKDGAGSAAPLVAALADQVLRAAARAAERSGGRLDPPMTVVLDEAANICRIADLPDLYSHLGSRGIVPITILQSYRQGVRVWGETGMDTLWSAATIKLIGAGLDDPRLAEDISRLIGEHDVEVRSHSRGHRHDSFSSNTSLRRQRILPPEDIRALPRNHALLFATGMRAARIQLLPWYESPRAPQISAAIQRALALLTTNARRKSL